MNDIIPDQPPADDAARAPRPERRMRSLVDDAHDALDVAMDAARVAGRTEVVCEEHPSDLTRSEADRADEAAMFAAEIAHGAVHALMRGRR